MVVIHMSVAFKASILGCNHVVSAFFLCYSPFHMAVVLLISLTFLSPLCGALDLAW